MGAALLAACRGAHSDVVAGASPTGVPEPAIAAFEAVGELPERLAHDHVWQRAASGDPTDLSALGRGEGAAALFGWITQGKRAGRVALEALPFAEDRADYTAPLCDLLVRLAPADRAATLRTLLRVVRSTDAAEPPSADAAERCVRVLSDGLGGAQSALEFDLRASLRQALEGLQGATSGLPTN